MKNIILVLLGASRAMQACSTYKLETRYATEKIIYFSTDCVNFVSWYKLELSNYGLTIEPEQPCVPLGYSVFDPETGETSIRTSLD